MDDSMSDGQSLPGGPGPGSRPGRAELRRAAEASATGASMSRLERRRLQEQQEKERRGRTSVWTARWLYPLLALIAVTLYLGVTSAGSGAGVPDGPTVSQIPDKP